MMRVGIIGMGFMGGVHLRNWQKIVDAQVIAVCDAAPIETMAKQGNLDVSPDALNLDGVAIYIDVAEMLSEESLDAVSITLPTHLHKAISIQCLEADVHVLCEKPMALNLEDCDAMIATAHQMGKQLMIAHCIRFWPEYQWAKQMIESGTYGSVVAADFSRLTFSPVWDEASWFSDQNKSGGIALDLHIHDLDYIQSLFGAPKSIRSSCAKLKSGITSHVQTFLEYGNDCVLSATASWALPESFGFQMGFKIILEQATLLFDSQAAEPLQLIPSEGASVFPELPQNDAYGNEIAHFAEQIKTPSTPAQMTPEQARESVRMALESIHS
jgi:predicted dehydrogenase